jgi:uncharacterized membrane protein
MTMTIMMWITVVCCVITWVNFVLTKIAERSTRDDLDEMRKCNEELAEAYALFRYGAIDEAIEIVKRAQGRAKERA